MVALVVMVAGAGYALLSPEGPARVLLVAAGETAFG